jgi:hypothetical protein
MALTMSRLLKQAWDVRTIAVTECGQCGATFGVQCRRSGKVRATPCIVRQEAGDDLRLWLFQHADILTGD